ncbi:hypothetical protein BDV25DRAFT_167835 [Aspergillus avenaceus]|uniref:Sequence orphan n=1 Tax=Aspergillus avenaceus TaxID=36643 RepID=A0A5N6U670_ASPAV|nr:hypothetical protein BDV25DRAFT_167835 [Aspergillus avenaceus]
MAPTESQAPGCWDSTLLGKVGGDLTAAAVSATLVSPSVSIFDRSLVEKSASNRPLLQSLRAQTISAFTHPTRFLLSRANGYNWALYAATFSVANSSDTIGKSLGVSNIDPITFSLTFLVNVPLGVWKDMRFAKLFGQFTDATAKITKTAPTRASSAAAMGTFLLRDAATIFGSFTLAPRCAAAIPDSFTTHPYSKTIITQMLVPISSQLVATPLHLLGLDLYNRPYDVTWPDRLKLLMRHLPSATALRCARIIPAFGVGCLANMGLRSLFHDACDNYNLPNSIEKHHLV